MNRAAGGDVNGRRSTIRDVAKLAGVSIQTVSAVLNGKPGITNGTTARVREAIGKAGYHPNTSARSLRTGRTDMIALIISDIANPSFGIMASAMEKYACESGLGVVFYNTHDDLERELQQVAAALQRSVDGILIVSVRDDLPSHDALRSTGIPFVAIERFPAGYSGPTVSFDNVAAGRVAAQHFVGLGHRRLAHIQGPADLRAARERWEGFRVAAAALGIDDCVKVETGGTWNSTTGYEAMRKVIAVRPVPTGVFCANDRIALGAMLAAHEGGLAIPADISILGLDGIEVSAFQVPPLSTIEQPFPRIATAAVTMLHDLMRGSDPSPSHVVMEPTLIARGSTGPSRR